MMDCMIHLQVKESHNSITHPMAVPFLWMKVDVNITASKWRYILSEHIEPFMSVIYQVRQVKQSCMLIKYYCKLWHCSLIVAVFFLCITIMFLTFNYVGSISIEEVTIMGLKCMSGYQWCALWTFVVHEVLYEKIANNSSFHVAAILECDYDTMNKEEKKYNISS